MSLYFSRFPSVRQGGQIARDITRRTNFIENNFSSPYLFLPYTIKQGEKPEDIADFYYGSVDYTWVVLMANNIIDVNREWYLTDAQLNKFIIEKYSDLSGLTDYKVLEWTQNQSIDSNIIFYYDEINDIKLNKESILFEENAINFRPIRYYEYETELNESRSEIQLIERSNISKVETDFKRLIIA